MHVFVSWLVFHLPLLLERKAGRRSGEGHIDKGLDPKRKAEPVKRFKQGRDENAIVLAKALWQNSLRSEQCAEWKERESHLDAAEGA